MKKTIIYLFIISVVLVFAITCQKKTKTSIDKSSDKPKWTQTWANVVDPDFSNSDGQMEYLAIAYAIIGGNPVASNNTNFRNALAESQYDVSGTGTDNEESDINAQYNDNAIKSTLTTWNGGPSQQNLDLGDAIIKWQAAPLGAPQGNGQPPLPFDAGFITGFIWRETANSNKPKSFFTYTNIIGADETHTNYLTHRNSYNTLPLLVVPLKDFEPSISPNPSNPYLPIKGYTWNTTTNALNIVTFTEWDDLEAAAMNTYYIVTVGFDRSDYTTTHTNTCYGDVVCGDGFCNTKCGENCSADCNSKYKLELTSVTLSEDAEVKINNSNWGLTKIPYREKYWAGKYAINYSVAVVHTDGSVDYAEDERYNRWKRKNVSRRYVDENNITGQIKHNGGTNHTHNNEKEITDNFVPYGPNGDRIYIIFWEDDWRVKNTIKAQLHRLPGNQYIGDHEFVFWSNRHEYPFGTKIKSDFEFVPQQYFGQSTPFPSENTIQNNHFMIIDFTDFTLNNAGTEGTYVYNDFYEWGDNTRNPRRGGRYGLSFSLRWRKTL